MRQLKLSTQSNDKDWSMQFMDESHYDTLLDENIAVYKPDGQPLLVLLKKAIDPQLAANAWESLKTIKATNKNRSTSIGKKATKYKNANGSLSNQSLVPKGWEVISDVIGYFDRSVRLPYGRACAWNAKHPQKFQRIVPLLQQTSALFAQHVPERFAAQRAFADKTHADWIIPETVYTTVTVNSNFRTAAHRDAGDLKEGFSNMVVIRQGKWTGANLVLPNWRIAAKLDHLDFVMFDAHEFHGNTQLISQSADANRCSLVCYYRERMIKCKSAKYELEQAQRRKPGQPIYWETDENSVP